LLLLAAAKIGLCLLVLSAFAAGLAVALMAAPAWLTAVVLLGPLVTAGWIFLWSPPDRAEVRIRIK
jgi:hypothetical protein